MVVLVAVVVVPSDCFTYDRQTRGPLPTEEAMRGRGVTTYPPRGGSGSVVVGIVVLRAWF